MTISTSRLLLRPIRVADAETIWPHVSDPEISLYMSWNPHRSIEETRTFIADVERRALEGGAFTWAIVERESGRIIGLVSLIAILRTHRALRYDKAELAYWIGRPYQGRGFATEACRAIIQYAFANLSLHKITVAHDLLNDASGKLISRLGFREIGIEREHFQKNGRWVDHKIYELLESEWQSNDR